MTHPEAYESRDLLIEIGTEELPPKALLRLSEAFAANLETGLDKLKLSHGALRAYATPRRLAVCVQQLAAAQPDAESTRRGPALSAAFDAEGRPTRAAEGFARSCGVAVDALQRLETEQGSWLAFHVREQGRPTTELLEGLTAAALDALPIPKRMRWGAGEAAFVRPVHWVVMLYGDDVVEAEILGVRAGRESRGHRFHRPGPLSLARAQDYPSALQREGQVLAEFAARRQLIAEIVEAAAAALGGKAVIEPALLDEVTALVEWPVVVSGSFDPEYLQLPPEVLIATLRDHQKYFHVVGGDGTLLAHFITVSNIESRSPQTVRAGNERVVRPRLSDAAYFWDLDRRRPLASRIGDLEGVVFQEKLGTLHDKAARVAVLAAEIASRIGGERSLAESAAMLAKCDLLSEMVGEFPELQGTMGRYYALHDGEPAEVAQAIDEHYRPRFAGDRLPETKTGLALAIADKLDTLVGIFGIGQPPSGDKDPFALRRAALGVLRIIIETALELDLEQLLATAVGAYHTRFTADGVADQVFEFMMERLRSYYLEDGITPDVFESVLARRPAAPHDFHQRIRAVMEFRRLPEAQSLAAANKRIRNILRQAGNPAQTAVADELLAEEAERTLAGRLHEMQDAVRPLFAQRDYTGALTRLAGLREAVDGFFDQVMVMSEDEALRRNRLALLNSLSELFLETADISRLQT